MNKQDDDRIRKLIHSIGLELNLQDDVVRKIVQSPYKFTRETIANLSIEGIKSEEDFDKIKTNFIYTYIGKLYTNYRIYEKIQKQKINLTEKWKKE